MNLLLCNDDGFEAPGILALVDALADLGTLWVAAPQKEQSAKSHAFTLFNPVRAVEVSERFWAIDGTPSDCVYLATQKLMDVAPDLVISGINRGGNLGIDLHYSGTVAAAREAAILGYPAMAISLARFPEDTQDYWYDAGQVSKRMVSQYLSMSPRPGMHLNINIPNRPRAEMRGVKTCAVGGRRYSRRVVEREDPWGAHYYWIGGSHEEFLGDADSDGISLDAGWVTVSPLSLDPTAYDQMSGLRDWNDG